MMGENQVVLGSDFPTVPQLNDAVKLVREAKLTARSKAKLLGQNALRLFGQ
jgi:predicted TIM-barrel fold metal-dependent hydrolase